MHMKAVVAILLIAAAHRSELRIPILFSAQGWLLGKQGLPARKKTTY